MRGWLYKINKRYDQMPPGTRFLTFIIVLLTLLVVNTVLAALQIMPAGTLIFGAVIILGIPRVLYIGGWFNP